MTPDESDVVVATLAGAGMKWTDQRYTDASAPLWTRMLAVVPFNEGMATVDALVVESSEFPTIAEFLARWKMIARRMRVNRLELPSETAMPAAAAWARIGVDGIEQCREALAHAIERAAGW